MTNEMNKGNVIGYDATKHSTFEEIAILAERINRELDNDPFLTEKDLAIKLGVSCKRINIAFKRINMNGYKAYHSELLEKEILKLYESGLNQKEIAEYLSTDAKTVRKYCSAKHAKNNNAYNHICTRYGHSRITWDAIKPLIEEGKTQVEVASILGCSRQRIQQICKTHGYNYNNSKVYRDKQVEKEIIKLYTNGLSQTEIAERLSINVTTVRRLCSASFAKEKGFYKKDFSRWDTIKPLLDEGKTYAEIGSLLGCTKQSVYRTCNNHGYKRRTK